MIILRWSQLPGSDVASFNVYRSIVGFRAPLVPLATLDGKTLELKINGGDLQTFTFDDTTDIVDLINATIQNGRAYLSDDGNSFFVRSDLRCETGSVEIVGGTALGDLGLTARLITEKSEDELVHNEPAPVDEQTQLEWEDPDGVLMDWYAITTVDSLGKESSKTGYQQPIQSSGPLCVIEGIVVDLQGVRIPDAEVIAEIVVPPECSNSSLITKNEIRDRSGTNGRFSLPVLQNSLIRLQVPNTGYDQNIRVPEKAYEFIGELIVDLDYGFIRG